MGQRKKSLLTIINIVALLGLVVLSILTKSLPFSVGNRLSTSSTFSVFFATLSINKIVWSIIYPLLFLFSIYQITMSRKGGSEDPIGKVGVWFFISAIAIGLSFFKLDLALLWPLLVLLVSLVILYIRVQQKDASLGYRIGVIFPFSVFLGWISIVAVNEITLNIYNAFSSYIPFSEGMLTLISLALIVVINFLAVLIYGDIWFSLVGVWTLVEFYLKLSQSSDADQKVNRITLAGIILLILSILIHLIIKGGRVARQEASI